MVRTPRSKTRDGYLRVFELLVSPNRRGGGFELVFGAELQRKDKA